MLIYAGLRVLDCWISGQAPPLEDLKLLRAAVPEPQSNWQSDDLARFIVERELKKQSPFTLDDDGCFLRSSNGATADSTSASLDVGGYDVSNGQHSHPDYLRTDQF